MGMYDDITVAREFELPGGTARRVFQTKCLECLLNHYHIDSSGRLLILVMNHIDDGPPGPHPVFKNWPDYQKKKAINHRYEFVEHTGTITFYGDGYDGIHRVWREYTATFDDGYVKRIEKTENP